MIDNILKEALLLTNEEMILSEFADNDNKELSLSDNFTRKINKLCKKYDKITFKLTYTRARKAICVFIAILLIMLSSLSVGAVREAISDFFIKHFSNHDVVKYQGNGLVETEYPDVIEEVYEISIVPEGYELIDCSVMETSVDTLYLSNDGQIALSQIVKSHHKDYIDNKYISIDYEYINNLKYAIYKYELYNIIIWDNGKYIFTLTSSLSVDTMLDLCKNLKNKN